jgi:hypothetical protein
MVQGPGWKKLRFTDEKMFEKYDRLMLFPLLFHSTNGLYYKGFTIVIYDRNDSGQYYKTRIMIVIDDPSLS